MGGVARLTTWIGAAGALLLVLGYVAMSDGEPDESTEHAFPRVLYDRTDHCGEPCHSAATSDTFAVTGELHEVHFVVYAMLDPSSGPAYVTVADPSGDVRYERLFMNDAGDREAVQDAVTWSAELGEWTLTRSYVGVAGMLDFQAWGEGDGA